MSTPPPHSPTQVKKRKRERNEWTLVEAFKKVRRINRIQRIQATWTGITIDQAQALCGPCKSLELTPDKFLISDNSGRASPAKDIRWDGGKFAVGFGPALCELGTLRDIRRKTLLCSFCRLVIKSLQEQPNSRLRAIAHGLKGGENFPEDDAVCFVSWVIDGREYVRDEHKRIVETRPRTRRIRLHWNADGFEDAYIVLLADTPEDPAALFRGRYAKSAKENLALVREWLSLCHEFHGQHCEISRAKEFEELVSMPYFSVIDVKEKRLCRLPKDKRYIALSYVWGFGDRFRTVSENVAKLQERGGLSKVFKGLPKTIQDAITLVENLGEQYLWVDSLCIVQDRYFRHNAEIMDWIFGHAHLTICAADGDDADAGLKGYDASERIFIQHIERYGPGVDLMVSHSSETYIKRSKWNTRAWTFQERLLSKRCLIFTEGRVYFHCRSTAMSEDIKAEQKQAGWSVELVHAPFQLLRDIPYHTCRVYMDSVKLYTARSLTNEADILAAFYGIGNTINKAMDAISLYGLPNSHFDLALLWQPQQAARRRCPERFPSWSWCGWSGSRMEYKPSSLSGVLLNLYEWLTHRTWITWFIRDGHGRCRLVWNSANQKCTQNAPVQYRWKGYDANIKEASTEAYSMVDGFGRQVGVEDCHKEHWGLTRCEFSQKLPADFGVSLANPNETCPDPRFPDMPYLQFFTWSAELRLTPDRDLREDRAPIGRGLRRFNICDRKDDWCGTIILNRTWRGVAEPGQQHEFVAISCAKDFSYDELASWNYYIPKDREQSEWDLYYVLLIEYEGQIARRVGAGKVFSAAFSNSCAGRKQWKEILLG
ncbi:MAG: hypothetical protein M1821_005783 [Bathelium mastoideum]|nr:MAG: hypothetical protein M1821_005783 [Bathelium mastoideum]